MLPDTGERYLSTPLFDDISADMDDEELALSESTPGYRFGTGPATKPAALPATTASERARAFLDQVVTDPDQPVVMFALEWCEFCWSVRKLFRELGIAYRSVDLDAVEYQKGNLGGDIRAALQERLGSPTIPQIFVGGTYIGGATETLDAFNDGSLQTLLKASNIPFDHTMRFDAYNFLPRWLHPRRAAG
jgi:cysteine synthase A